MARKFRGRQRMLLCIDDSGAILEYEKSLFEKSGYIVVTTSSPLEGLRLARLFTFDAVLLDYQMPQMNGHEVALALRLLQPAMPVVIFSGSEIPAETYKLVDAVIPKTGSGRELLPAVTRLCDLSSPD